MPKGLPNDTPSSSRSCPKISWRMAAQILDRRVVVVGSANMDMVVSCERFPRPGETVLADKFGMYPGGKGANQAVACAKLGGNVALLAKMGDDMFRERLAESLGSSGVDLSHVLVHEAAPTGIALITVDRSGQNEIVVVSGSNMQLSPDDVRAHEDVFEGAAVVLLQLEIPIETVVEAARRGKSAGALVVLNPAPGRDLPDELLKNVDVITPNESEAEILSGIAVSDQATALAAAAILQKRGVSDIVITLGSRGALHVAAGSSRQFPAYEVEPVDTTAAGDAFTGALAFGLASGQEVPESIVMANAVAAFAVTRMGAQTSMPSFAELSEFLEEHPEPELQG